MQTRVKKKKRTWERLNKFHSFKKNEPRSMEPLFYSHVSKRELLYYSPKSFIELTVSGPFFTILYSLMPPQKKRSDLHDA